MDLPEPGDTVGGKYTLGRRIGEGGMGVVHEATHVRLQQRLAIKFLRPDAPELDEVVKRFEREARAAACLQSIHVARVIDVDALPSGIPYMVLEYLEGRDLEAELAETGPLPVAEAVDLALQVADAMVEAHSLGIVHRDLKPSNLFICRLGDPPRRFVKVLDFGISKIESEDGARITSPDAYFGTPYYASPEQLRSAWSVDAPADVWSLGVVLYELLTGRTPFTGSLTQVIARVVADPVPWPLDFRADLPRELARALLHALNKDPALRFQSMREFAQAIAPFGSSGSMSTLAAEAPPGRGRLGEILVSDGLLANADLERALVEHRHSGKRLGRALLDLGLVAQSDLLTALAKQQGIIVTREQPGAMDIERSAREAATLPPRAPEPPRARPAPRLKRWRVMAAAAALVVVAAAGLAVAWPH